MIVTGTPWTWTPLMLMVCTACGAGDRGDVFRVIIPPAGAILASVRSFRPPWLFLVVNVCVVVVETGVVTGTMEDIDVCVGDS